MSQVLTNDIFCKEILDSVKKNGLNIFIQHQATSIQDCFNCLWQLTTDN